MMGALSLLSSLQSLDWTAQNAVLKQLLIKVEIADGLADRRILGLFHRFFKLFRKKFPLFGSWNHESANLSSRCRCCSLKMPAALVRSTSGPLRGGSS